MKTCVAQIVRSLVGVAAILAVAAGCASSELTQAPEVEGPLAKEGMAFSRIALSPVNIIGHAYAQVEHYGSVGVVLSPILIVAAVPGGTMAVCSDILTGLGEMLTLEQARRVKYPWQSFNYEDSERWAKNAGEFMERLAGVADNAAKVANSTAEVARSIDSIKHPERYPRHNYAVVNNASRNTSMVRVDATEPIDGTAGASAAESVPAIVTADSVSALTLGELPQALMARGDAIKAGDWSQAVHISRRMLLYDRDGDMPVPINAVTDYMYLFFCAWNMGNKTFALNNLRDGIAYMSSKFGNNCDSRAKVLLAKAEEGKLPEQFTSNDIQSSAGICCFILEMPKAVSERHHAALMNQIQASTDVYRKEGEWQASHAKFHAKREYEDKYHRSFDPNDRPPEGSQRRDDWDSCKRIYDIFDMSH